MVRANNLLCDIEHMQKIFETTQEMVNRGMVGVEAWLTEKGLVTHGSPAAREAMLIKYEGEGNIENIQTVIQEGSLQAAQNATTHQPTNQVAETLISNHPSA